MRLYQNIWKQLLQHKKITVKCRHPSNAVKERLIKAVFKEKDMDIASRKDWCLRCDRMQGTDMVRFLLLKRIDKADI